MAAPTQWRQAVLDAVEEVGLQHLADLVMAALHEAVPVLAEDQDLADVARVSAIANVALVIQTIEGTVSVEEFAPPPQAIGFARELARRGVEVGALASAYRSAQHALWRWTVDAIRARVDDPAAVAEAIENLSEATFLPGDRFGAIITDVYAREREQWLRGADAIRGETVRALLRGEALDPDVAAARLGYALTQEHEAFVVWGDAEDALPEVVAAAIGGRRALVVGLGVGLVAGWAPPGALALDAAGADARIALGSPAAGPAGFRQSHLEALEARRVAQLTGRRGQPVRYDDVALLALLTKDHDQARVFARRTLGPLAADDDAATRRLAETLLVVLEEQGSPRRAGQRLGVHENTVAKRLRSIEERGGPTLAQTGPRAAELLAALVILRAEWPD